MARWAGVIAFANQVETAPGVFSETIVERPYRGSITRNINRWEAQQSALSDDLKLNCGVSIIADSFANENYGFMKYIAFGGSKWKISSVETAEKRLTIYMGGAYNGE